MHGVKRGFGAALSIVLEEKNESNVATVAHFSVLHHKQLCLRT